MGPLTTRRICCLALLLASSLAQAQTGPNNDGPATGDDSAAAPSKPRSWGGAMFVYGHVVGTGALDTSYAQSFSFRPRITFLGGYFVGLRLDLEIDLSSTDAVDVDHAPWVSDLYIDAGVDLPALTIPVLGITVGPRLRLGAPTSAGSRARSLQLVLAPGLRLGRSFTLHDGWLLNRLELFYRFFSYKYLNEYETAGAASGGPGPAFPTDIDDPGLHPAGAGAGVRNTSWRLENTLGLRLRLLTRLILSVSAIFLDDFFYELEPESLGPGLPVGPVEANNHRAKIVALFDLTYQVFDWLWLTAGVSHVASQLDSSAGFYPAYGPGRTVVFFDLTVPVDGIIQAVQGRK